MNEKAKLCPKCGLEKPLEFFYRKKTSKDGRCHNCAECQKKYLKDHYVKRTQYYKDKSKKYDKDNPISRRAHAIKARAKRNGFDCDIDSAWFADQIEKGCAITGLPFDLRWNQGLRAPEVDRIEAGGSYLKANCRVVWGAFNRARGNKSEEDTILAIKQMAEKM